MKTLFELINYLISEKKYLLIPVVFVLFTLGILLFLTQGTVFAPFIYTIF